MLSWRLIIYINVLNRTISLNQWFVPLIIDWYYWRIVIAKSLKLVRKMAVSSASENHSEYKTDYHYGEDKFEYKWYEESDCTKYNPKSY
ncbi:hypothetical protein ASF92_01260 [Pedobacter sp. Leaf176]|nr:hypothetical protein ASF92_01260 [Pedobacter sp. Leaf176]